MPRIPDAEFLERIENLRAKMQGRNIDLLVAYSNDFDPGHVRYFADVVGVNEACALVVPAAGEPIVCVGPACQAWGPFKSRLKDVRVLPEVGEVSSPEYLVGDQGTFAGLFKELAGKYKVKKIGTVGRTIFPQLIYARLQEAFPQASFVNAEPMVFELRVRKSADEIACMRKAAQILDKAHADAVKKIKPGWTEREIMGEIVGSILKGGAECWSASWPPMYPSGREHSNLCMNRNSMRKVREGEIIDLQSGATYEGYNAALCSPLVLGEIPAEIKRPINVAHETMQAIVAKLQPGATSREVNATGKAVLNKAGLGQFSPYAMVHNIGLLECESPWMSHEEDYPLAEGMVVCVDVFLFRLPWGSFRIENTLALTADGADRLTTFNDTFVPAHFQ